MPNSLTSGFSRSAVEELSRRKGEPEWMLQKRLEAWDIYESMPTPLGRRGDLGTLRMFSNFKFQELSPYVPSIDDGKLPAPIEQALQEALVDQRAGVVVQRNASVVRTELDEELKRQGVILTDLDSAVRDYPELVQQYFMTTCVPVNSTKYTALHAAFWSGGIFLYIPKGIEIEDPILAQIWIDTPASATFAHTLIIAEEQSSVRYVEEHNSAFDGDRPSLLVGVVEVYVKNAAHVEFSNMQDLGLNVWNITKNNAFHENDGTTTCALPYLTPNLTLSDIGIGLTGNGSAGELVGGFFTDHDQRYSINTLSDHASTATNAETLVKGVLTDESRVEVIGMIRIRPKAQPAASFLSGHTLMLNYKRH